MLLAAVLTALISVNGAVAALTGVVTAIRDYWRLGLPLLALFGVVAIGLVPVFWPL